MKTQREREHALNRKEWDRAQAEERNAMQAERERAFTLGLGQLAREAAEMLARVLDGDATHDVVEATGMTVEQARRAVALAEACQRRFLL